jgi:GPH family glycoside/pentoside/hexuronide:cation symporter/probable glucitol transport protein GutA
MLPLGNVAQERHQVKEDENPSVGGIFKAVFHNKYLMLFLIAFLIGNVTNTVLTVTGYFAINCLGGPEMISIISTVPMLAAGIFVISVPIIIKHIGKFNLFLIMLAIGIAMCVTMFFVGYSNLFIYLALASVRMIALGFCSTFPILYFIDCAEYGRYKTGDNIMPVAVSLQTFSVKALGAISASLGMFILGLAGFVEGADAVQPPQVLKTIWFMVSIMPAFGLVIAFVILLFGYKLRDKDIQIMASVNNGEMTREEAESLFSRKF